MKKKFTFLMAALMLLTIIGLPGKAVGQTRATQKLTNANIVAAGDASSSYASWSISDGSNTWNAYAIKNKHSNATASYHYLQIKKYASSTAYYIQVPTLGTKITSIKMTVSSSSQPMNGGGNSATLYFSSSNSTSATGTGVASGTGASSVTIDCSSLNLNTGYITASAAVRIWDVEVTYTTSGGGGGSSVTAPEITPSCAFETSQTVTITPADGTTAYYTTDGSTPSNTSTVYTVPFTVTSTTTVKAIAYEGDDASSVVSATYTKITTIASITAAGTYAVKGTVVAKSGYGMVIGDGTGYIYYANGYVSPSQNVNDVIMIAGSVTEKGPSGSYAKVFQFTNTTSTITTATDSGYNGNPVVTIITDALPFYETGSHLSNYYQFTGVLDCDASGYYNVQFGNNHITISNPHATTQKPALNNLLGEPVTVKGYFAEINNRHDFAVVLESVELYNDPDAPEYEWVVADITNLTSDDIFVIVGTTSGGSTYALPSVAATASPSVASVTVEDGAITSAVAPTMKWRITSSSSGYTFNQNGYPGNYLYCNDSNTGVRVGSNTSNNLFTIDNGYLKNTSRNRYIGIYETTDWRCYTSINSNISGQTFAFYKRQEVTSDPTVSASPSTINDFSYIYGAGPSIKSFTVEGSNLSSNVITVALTTHTAFQLSLDENAEIWYNSLTLSPTDGTVANTTVYVRMNAGLDEGDYSDNITVSANGATSVTVSLSGAVNPVPETYTYILANTIEVGKHYLITSGKTGSVYVMGHQKSNNRNGVSVTVDSNGKISVTSDVINTNNNVYEFVISGYGTDHWTIYDENTQGYLFAASSSSNYLKTQTTNDENGTWSVTIDGNTKVASIVAQGSNSRNVMQFNSDLFACYSASSYDDVYLFVKENDNDCHIYSATALSSTNKITVPANGILTVNGDYLTNDEPANLIIEDGGQLILPSSGSKTGADVKATFQKEITAYTVAAGKDHYYLIANPTTEVEGINPDDVGMLDNNYDLYYFDESIPGIEWRNYKKVPFNLVNGKGYLYANSSNLTLEFPGTVLPGTTANITLSKSGSGTYKGFNLVGNPLSNNITSMNIEGAECDYYKLDSEGSFVVSNKAIIVGEAFMVEAPNNGDKLYLNPSAKDEDGFTNEVIRLEVSNSKFTDVAFVYFGNHLPLTKINHLNDEAPKLYIHNENSDKAVEVYNNRGEVKSINVNFEAKTIGTYTISAKMVKGEIKYMHLYDRFTGIDTDLLIDDYSFIGANEDQPGRFILKLEAIDNEFEGSDNFAYQSGNNIMVNGEGELQIFDVMGRMVMNERINGVESISGLSRGIYIFRVIGETQKTQKIVVR